ncbi:Serine/threonine protein kinase [Handroanthus impetiginosus]|uniref:Serine/threonine protein kinase n=1 Tax=Handroanthus impetiginosus TaxID=429701 RepID=A0A2G9I860_9LAMI|nr:Serine/threonine protein kinase [Handroanthus impetiginosus]
MHPKPNRKCILFIILSVYFPAGFSSQMKQENTTCFEPFRCGSINISYPFWGGHRPPICGHQGFEIHCNGDVPLLNISSVFYRVLEIDSSNHTLKVAREDLWNNSCPSILHNTTLNPNYLNGKSVTLYFNYMSNKQETLPNEFSCHRDGVNTVNLFKTGDASPGPRSGITCSNYISVTVNHASSKPLKTPMASTVNVLQGALASRFSVKRTADYSARCEYNGTPGSCYAKCVSKGSTTSCSTQVSLGPVEQSSPVASAPRSPVAPAPRSPIAPPPHSPVAPAPRSRDAPPPRSPATSAEPPLALDKTPSQGPSNPRNSSIPAAIRVAIAVGVTAGIITLSIVIVYLLKRRHSTCRLNQGSNQDVENFLLQHGSLAPTRYRYSEIEMITKSFKNKLGQGGYGTVYKGTLLDGCAVAVKVLINIDSNGEEFINEVASISRTSHVNIVNLLGFSYERNKRALVYEFMPNKSLDKFILSSADSQLGLEKLYKIALGVAKGLEYLHTGFNTRIVHFDIKPQNILLDEDFCPKISNFGLAKLCKKKQSILSVFRARGTIGYIAPEMFSRNFGGVSHKSDVYSYGMMLLEMAGARNIIQTETIQSSENYFPDRIYDEVILDMTTKLDDYTVEEGDDTRRKMFLVGFWCIQTTPSDRPSISKVVEMLEGSLQSIQIPPKPFLFAPKVTEQESSPSLSACTKIENSSEGLRPWLDI